MIEFLLGAAVVISIINLIFFLTGYFAAKGTLQDKVREIVKARQRTGGVATPLEPRELDKKRSREILDRFQK